MSGVEGVNSNCTNNGDYERNWLTLETVILLIRVRASVVTPVLEIVVCSGGVWASLTQSLYLSE